MAAMLGLRTKSSMDQEPLHKRLLRRLTDDRHVFRVCFTLCSINICGEISDIGFLQSTEMSVEEQRALEALQELPIVDDNDVDYYDPEDINMKDILDGSATLNISHGGGEFNELANALRANLSKGYVTY
jgi:hypothetical protein